MVNEPKYRAGGTIPTEPYEQTMFEWIENAPESVKQELTDCWDKQPRPIRCKTVHADRHMNEWYQSVSDALTKRLYDKFASPARAYKIIKDAGLDVPKNILENARLQLHELAGTSETLNDFKTALQEKRYDIKSFAVKELELDYDDIKENSKRAKAYYDKAHKAYKAVSEKQYALNNISQKVWEFRIAELAKKNRLPETFILKQLRAGIGVENEHKQQFEKLGLSGADLDNAVAEVAMEHLTESPFYYEELDKIERKIISLPRNLRKLQTKLTALGWSKTKYADGGLVYFESLRKIWDVNFDEFKEHYILAKIKELKFYEIPTEIEEINTAKRKTKIQSAKQRLDDKRKILQELNYSALEYLKSNHGHEYYVSEKNAFNIFNLNVYRAIENLKYQQAIANGEMIRDRAIEIIESANLPVPEDILNLKQTPHSRLQNKLIALSW